MGRSKSTLLLQCQKIKYVARLYRCVISATIDIHATAVKLNLSFSKHLKPGTFLQHQYKTVT